MAAHGCPSFETPRKRAAPQDDGSNLAIILPRSFSPVMAALDPAIHVF
jgi:hypothetical protein